MVTYNGKVSFDIVLPIYNSLHHARPCIESIFSCSTQPFKLHIIDDGSHGHVKEQIREILKPFPAENYSVHQNDSNMGYLKSCNTGILNGSAEYVILVNSDTIMTKGHLEKIEAVFQSDSTIGVVNPISTWANWTRIPFPAGYTLQSLAEELGKRNSQSKIQDIFDASGFYFAVRRALFNEIGLFEECYAPGYWEEADFCMRAIQRNYRVVVDESIFIFHHGWGTFGAENRNPLMERNKKIFMKKWQDVYQPIKDRWSKQLPVQSTIEHLTECETQRLNSPTVISPKVARRLLADIKGCEKKAFGLKRMYEGFAAHSVNHSNPISVTYVLPAIKLYGGVISVIQIVNQLILRGVNATIATWGEVDEDLFKTYPAYFRPLTFASEEELVSKIPKSDLIIATAWDTVYPVLLISAYRQIKCAYFVQDFEVDFLPKDNQELRNTAELTYQLISEKIVKTPWLKNKLLKYGGSTTIIPLGLNTDIFYDRKEERRRQVLAMARPSSHHRNFATVREVFTKLAARDTSIELVLYGTDDASLDLPKNVRSVGKLSNQRDVASILNQSKVLLDCSLFQGFGRPGLEAMACGTATVLTKFGGITSYAKHEYNTLLCQPENVEDIVNKVTSLLDGPSKCDKLIKNGLLTAGNYSYLLEGERTHQYFLNLLED